MKTDYDTERESRIRKRFLRSICGAFGAGVVALLGSVSYEFTNPIVMPEVLKRYDQIQRELEGYPIRLRDVERESPGLIARADGLEAEVERILSDNPNLTEIRRGYEDEKENQEIISGSLMLGGIAGMFFSVFLAGYNLVRENKIQNNNESPRPT